MLPFLKHFTKKRNIREFSGKKVGVDAMCWMHRGAYACSEELVTGKDTDRFIQFFLMMCESLHYHKVKPVIVFDGARLPAKLREEQQRMETREKAKEEALELLRRRDAGEAVDLNDVAAKCKGAIRVTNSMISRLMGALKELQISFIVAPYEADAQLAYLCRVGWVEAVISEDSDLLAYGCPSTLFKMDKFGDGENVALPCLQPGAQVRAAFASGGTGLEDLEDPEADPEAQAAAAGGTADGEPAPPPGGGRGRGGRGRGRGRGRRGRGGASEEAAAQAADEGADGAAQAVPKAKAKSKASNKPAKRPSLDILGRWSPEKFAEFCVLLGTDYRENDIHIKGLGPKTAFRLMCRFKSAIGMIQWMRGDPKWMGHFPGGEAETFLTNYRSVVAVFWHHVVFDPRRGECVSLAVAFPESCRELPGIDIIKVCGAPIVKEQAKLAARGEVDPRTLQKRVHEPLTPAERATLDRRLAAGRVNQRKFENEHRRKAEAEALMAATTERAAAAKEKLLQEGGAAASGAQLEGGDPESHGHVVADPEADRGTETEKQEPPPRPEMRLAGSDVGALFAAKAAAEVEKQTADAGKQAADGNSDTPPRNPAAPEARSTLSPTAPLQRYNPFARKRPAIGSGLDGGAPGSVDSCAVISKRPRIMAAPSVGSSSQNSSWSRPASNGVGSEASKDGTSDARPLAAPRLHPRGGYAAMEAAMTVLSHRGHVEVEKLDESKDRSKMFFFLKPGESSRASKKPTADKTEAAPRRGLSAWRARPWEAPTQEAHTSVAVNPLSLSAARGNPWWQRK